MIYSCQHCGAWFTAEELNKAASEKQSVITCKYCNNVNDLGLVKTSHVAKGYDCLEKGEFFHAEAEFKESLKVAQNLDMGAKSAYLDAYLGQALARFSVQVIYADEIADKNEFPEINCFLSNESKIEDDYDFQIACEIAKHINNDSNRALELNRLNRFASIIDGIKNNYDKMAASGEKYQLFVAYEDKSKDYASSYAVASKIRNDMPGKINKIFLPNIDEYLNDIEYEAAILYAIHNSTSMLVVTDSDMDARLMNIYSRYYWAMVNSQNKHVRKELGFVWYANKIQVHLPDHKISKNIFGFEDTNLYHKFVHEANNIIYDAPVGYNPLPIEENEEVAYTDDAYVDTTGGGMPVISGNMCRFGSYPQRLEKDVNIINEFRLLPKPSPASENGWNVMFVSKKGQPYTWYLDKEINGKKYRAVYFMRFREVFSIHDSDINPSVQRIARYNPMHIYVFAYEPIEWNVLDLSMSSAVLLSSIGLDSREYNNSELASSWQYSTIKNWLNYDFYNTAFNENEKKYLFERDDEYVSLLDKEMDFSKHYRVNKIANYNIAGSDYFRCIGGLSDQDVGKLWVKSENCNFEEKAFALQPHSVNDFIPQYVDSTSISVVPKVIVRFTEN